MRRVAIVGAGMTRFVRRAQETGKELAWQAASKALESCEMTLDDIDCVVIGTAPEAFDGVHMKSEYLSDASGAWRKPVMRGYVGGGTAGCLRRCKDGITSPQAFLTAAWSCAKRKCPRASPIPKARS